LIAILAGGTGSVKLARGLALLEKGNDITIIANVGDNFWLYGLYICPDIDTIIYGLADMLDEKRGWGVRGDTFSFLDQLRKSGYDTWFGLGDRDLVMHVLRTDMMKGGKKQNKKLSLTDITAYFAKKFGANAQVLPATDSELETLIRTEQFGEMHLQEFWVKHAGRPKVLGVRYRGIDNAQASKQVLNAIKNSDRIVIAPGNPISSIGPTLAIKDIKAALVKRRQDVFAVSPIVCSSALSGPAVKYMRAQGVRASIAGVADFYQGVAGNIVIDSQDREFASKMGIARKLCMQVYETNIIMRGRQDELRLGRYLLQLRKSKN
jgi:LPPG:FO 2-phospho-L-lactate transferase